MDSYGAIVLAGGQARRLGGVHKPGLLIGGVPLLHRVLAAVPGARPRVVVGPTQPVPADVLVVRESPAGGGPVAALAAGLTAVGDVELVALLAGDLPFLTVAVLASLREAARDQPGAVLIDADGRDQFLAGVYRVSALAEALRSVGPPSGVPMRRVVAGLQLARVRVSPDGAPPWLDCDDADDVRAAERLASGDDVRAAERLASEHTEEASG
ncbi:molybdenum cofactor guanylyltransferase [Cryptosporangium arvum]|uniref:molybdenum cofactor guanylyltransferase n=1 Tax=Cryptosporangium arvum TaxID=80871 RepID=UPI0004B840DE|nr:NTP transferase domain-containing protein [Cryptosporangium arvum]